MRWCGSRIQTCLVRCFSAALLKSCVTPVLGQAPGDWNNSGVIDPSDFLGLETCLTGPLQATGSTCGLVFDPSGLGHVSMANAMVFQPLAVASTQCTSWPVTNARIAWHLLADGTGPRRLQVFFQGAADVFDPGPVVGSALDGIPFSPAQDGKWGFEARNREDFFTGNVFGTAEITQTMWALTGPDLLFPAEFFPEEIAFWPEGAADYLSWVVSKVPLGNDGFRVYDDHRPR